MRNSNLRRTDIRTSVDEANNNLVMSRGSTNSVVCRKENVGSITARLVPTLHSSTDGASEDGQEESHRHSPFVGDFLIQDLEFSGGELFGAVYVVDVGGILCDQRALLEERSLFLEPSLLSKELYILHELFSRNA